MTDAFPAVEDLTPHRGGMLLISRIVAEGADELTAEITIAPDHPFLVPGKGVPAYVALEMMAQTISAKDGLEQQRAGNPPAIGFLLGCQRFKTYREWLQVGETLTCHVFCRLDADGLGSFECELRSPAGGVLAKGNISVFRPQDAAGFVEESGIGA